MTEETALTGGETIGESIGKEEIKVMEGKEKGHPKGLYLLFTTEMWERFSYYGMRAILKLFMLKVLFFPADKSSLIYGNFTGLVYLTPLLGGFLSDRYLGNRRSIFIGGIVMALGQFLLFFSASYGNLGAEHVGGMQMNLFYAGLFALIIGNGFFKPNISTMVNQLYPRGDSRLDSAFSIFYMGINLGALLSPLVCSTLAEKIDFRWGFFAAGVGMVVSLIFFELLKNRFLVTPAGEKVGGAPNTRVEVKPAASNIAAAPSPAAKMSTGLIGLWVAVLLGLFFVFFKLAEMNIISSIIYSVCISASGYVISDPSLSKGERNRIWVIYIIAFFVIFFWAAFEQAGNTLTDFADKQTDRFLGSWEMPAGWFQSVNPVCIVIFAPIFAIIWDMLRARKMEPSSPVKQAFGLFFLALGYLVIAFGVKGVAPDQKISMMYLMILYFIHTVGELCLSPIGLSMVARLAPMRLASLLMGIWFMSNAVANDFSGVLGALYPAPGEVKHFAGMQITNMYDFFMLFVYMAGAAGVVLLLISSKLNKMAQSE